jgi:hypothetical protein
LHQRVADERGITRDVEGGAPVLAPTGSADTGCRDEGAEGDEKDNRDDLDPQAN